LSNRFFGTTFPYTESLLLKSANDSYIFFTESAKLLYGNIIYGLKAAGAPKLVAHIERFSNAASIHGYNSAAFVIDHKPAGFNFLVFHFGPPSLDKPLSNMLYDVRLNGASSQSSSIDSPTSPPLILDASRRFSSRYRMIPFKITGNSTGVYGVNTVFHGEQGCILGAGLTGWLRSTQGKWKRHTIFEAVSMLS
jgi:hypothetical protein